MVARKNKAVKPIILEQYDRKDINARLLSEEKAAFYQAKHPDKQIVFDGDFYALVAIPNTAVPGAIKNPYYFKPIPSAVAKGKADADKPIVVKELDKVSVPYIAVSDELDKLNELGQFNGIPGEYSFDGDNWAIVFVPDAAKARQKRPAAAQGSGEVDLKDLGLDVVG